MKQIKKHFLFIFFITLYALSLGYKLYSFSYPFLDWDESIYTQVAREMLQNRTIFETYNGVAWLEKPPFVTALIAIIFGIFGSSEFWARLVILLTGLLVLILTYFLSRKIVNHLWGKKLSSLPLCLQELIILTPVLALAGAPQFLDRASIVNVDIFLALSWIGYFLFKDRFWLKLLFLSIGVMSKSLLGFYPLLVELFLIRKKSFTKKNIIYSVFLVTLPLLWHFAAFIKYGNQFIEVHFLDHMVRRLTTPIELHFGGKWYYFQLLIQNMSVFLPFIFASYLFIIYDIVTTIKKKWVRIFQLEYLWDYLILFSPLPFLVLLTLGKSKLSWYLFPLLPLFALSIPYAILKIKNNIIQTLIVILMSLFFLIQFVPPTFFSYPAGASEKVTLAKCISKLPQKKIAFYVNADERKIQNVLEAAHLDISTSFNYGGSPSFVFYSEKHVDFFYNIDQFINSMNRYSLIVISKKDYETNQQITNAISKYKEHINCSTQSWISFVQ